MGPDENVRDLNERDCDAPYIYIYIVGEIELYKQL